MSVSFAVHFILSEEVVNSFPNDKILDLTKMKEYADDNSKVDENGRRFSKWTENSVGQEEIACYKLFLLFPQSFLKTCTTDTYRVNQLNSLNEKKVQVQRGCRQQMKSCSIGKICFIE